MRPLQDPMTASVALLALSAAAFGVACALAGAGWMKARSASAWQALSRERELLVDLVDEWLWQADADLRIRLCALRPASLAGWRVPPRSASA